jgi:predicted HTH transcriptional regulator
VRKIYPKVAIRELIANALIHQDFLIRGMGPMVEIFDSRLEVSNPGKPLIDTNRFIDHAPKSRNEILTSLMRRMNICEERGSGVDRVIDCVEVFQLPAPDFQEEEDFLRVTLFKYRKLNDMEKDDKIRACYQHCCLKWVCNERMTNSTLRKRLGIEEHNYTTASHIIKDTIDVGLIKDFDPENRSNRTKKYIPFWA